LKGEGEDQIKEGLKPLSLEISLPSVTVRKKESQREAKPLLKLLPPSPRGEGG
jgi:hypothetical protein